MIGMDRSIQKYAGTLIRLEREKRSWNQEGLCRGICAVSYLSKIETGRTDCSMDIIRQLFARLGIEWHDDPSFCAEAERQIDAVYERIYGLEETPQDRQWILAWNKQLKYSPYMADAAVLEAWLCRHESVVRDEYPAFSGRQAALLRILEGKPEEALYLYPCALTSYHAGFSLYMKGEGYGRSIDFLQQAYRLAAEEGRIRIMMTAKIMIANWYSNMHDLDAMEESLVPAERIAKALHDEKTIRVLNYNRFSSRIEEGRYEEAYAYFSSLCDPDVMELHKLAVSCEKTGRPEEAEHALSDGRKLPSYADSASAQKMYDLVERRLKNAQYLQDAEYGKALLDTFQYLEKHRPFGYASFHLPWVLEWYTSSRQYRAAFELLRSFPVNVK